MSEHLPASLRGTSSIGAAGADRSAVGHQSSWSCSQVSIRQGFLESKSVVGGLSTSANLRSALRTERSRNFPSAVAVVSPLRRTDGPARTGHRYHQADGIKSGTSAVGRRRHLRRSGHRRTEPSSRRGLCLGGQRHPLERRRVQCPGGGHSRRPARAWRRSEWTRPPQTPSWTDSGPEPGRNEGDDLWADDDSPDKFIGNRHRPGCDACPRTDWR